LSALAPPPPSAPIPSPSSSSAPPPAAKVDLKVLDAYVGQYDTPFGLLSITREGDRLFGQPNGDTKEELVPESESIFNVPAVGVKVTFVKDASGLVSHMIINQGGQEVQAKKIK